MRVAESESPIEHNNNDTEVQPENNGVHDNSSDVSTNSGFSGVGKRQKYPLRVRVLRGHSSKARQGYS